MAVSDTGEIREKAEIYSYISRVETISYLESVLLGDPFDFLSNVPVWLRRMPSGSVLRQLYRSPACSRLFSRLGAGRLLLFYSVLPDKQVVLRPNAPRDCCGLAEDGMGRDIILEAKRLLGKQRRQQKDEEEGETLDQLSREVRRLRRQMETMDDMARKIDLLLAKK